MLTRIRYAIRSLSKAPLLSLVVVLSLGLGIGANTAIFSLLHQVVLRSLPVQRPNELVLLTAPADTKGGNNSTGDAGGMEYIFSYPMFRELEKEPAGLTGLAAFRQNGANLAELLTLEASGRRGLGSSQGRSRKFGALRRERG